MSHKTSANSSPWLPLPFEVVANHQDSADTNTLTIKPAAARYPETALPGQFMMLYAFGVGEIPVSLSGIGKGELQHTIRKVGAVSKALTELKPGQQLGLRGPFGTPWPFEASQNHDVIVLAGGLGIAPLKPLIEELLVKKTPVQKIYVLYGARDEGGLIYQDLCRAWGEVITVERTLDSASADWQEHVGVVPELLNYVAVAPEKTIAYVCGPEIMMRFSIDKLLDLGLEAHQIYLSMERNMKCAVGLCGHCQYGGTLICRDGAVFSYPTIEPLFKLREV